MAPPARHGGREPTVQQYRNAAGDEGSNGQLRLDDYDTPVQQHHVWLDEIASINRLPPRRLDPRSRAHARLAPAHGLGR